MRKINTFNLCFLHKNPKKYVSTPKTDITKTFEIFYKRKISCVCVCHKFYIFLKTPPMPNHIQKKNILKKNV